LSWRGLRHKGRERLFRHEWNAVVDALNDLHSWLTSGQQDINVNEVRARTGNFSEQLLVQGRPVLKDGDPISIQQFHDTAVDQIVEAIDRSKVAQLLETYAPKLEELLEELKPVWARGGITASDNTEGFHVDLYKGGRPNVTLYYSVGGPATIYLMGSIDGTTWRILETITTTEAEERAIAFMAVAYPYVRAETPTTGIDVFFELVASR
jgi:hypothetical protein